MKTKESSTNKIDEINNNTKEATKDMFMELAPYFIILICIILLRTFIATPVMVNGSSMTPTLENRQVMVLYKLTKKFRGIKRFDIVVIDEKGGDLIKRVVGLPGERIRYSIEDKPDGTKVTKLLVNDKEIEETFLDYDHRILTCNQKGENDFCSHEIKLGKDEYYVLGDNRGNSQDSRIIGPVNISEIKGTTKLRLWPLNKIGNVK